MARIKLTFVDQIPTPYRVPLYRELHNDSSYEVRVLYCQQPPPDRGWRGGPMDYPHRILPGVTLRGRHQNELYLNPAVVADLRHERPHAVIVSGWLQPTVLLGAMTARAMRMPYVVLSESHGGRARGPLRQLVRGTVFIPVVRGAAAVLAAGSLAREYAIRLGITEEAVFICPNACDVENIHLASNQARASGAATRLHVRLAANRPLVVFVGRLVPAKGVDVLLDALSLLADRRPKVACAIAGPGKQRTALERRAAELRLQHVTFLGEIPNAELPSLYAAADLVCLPSFEEPWGVVVAEAMAAGAPVVVSDAVGAGPDLVRPGSNGAVFAAGDSSSLANALDGVLRLDPVEASRQARQAASVCSYERAKEGLMKAIARAVGSPA